MKKLLTLIFAVLLCFLAAAVTAGAETDGVCFLKNGGSGDGSSPDSPVGSFRDAVRAVARKALERNIGARGLRAIMENTMMDLMYRLPSDDTIGICTITEDVVEKGAEPVITYRDVIPERRTEMSADNLVG